MQPNFRQTLVIFWILVVNSPGFAQIATISQTIHWNQHDSSNKWISDQIQFDLNGEPYWYHSFPLPENYGFSAELIVRETQLTEWQSDFAATANQQFELETYTKMVMGKPYGGIKVKPIAQNGNSGLLLTYFDVVIEQSRDDRTKPAASSYKKGLSDSKLANGNWYKVGVTESGIYKIDYNYLQEAGIDPGSIDAKKANVFGYGGNMLPEVNNLDRPEDLALIKSLSVGLDDGRFNQNDYLLFYAEGPNTWDITNSGDFIRHIPHSYTDTICYFLNFDYQTHQSPTSQASENGSPDITTSAYDYLFVHSIERFTDINKHVKSGQDWFGEEFNYEPNQQFDVPSIPGRLLNEPVKLRSYVAARSIPGGTTSRFKVSLNKAEVFTQSVSGVRGNSDSPYANVDVTMGEKVISGNPLQVQYEYFAPNSQANGWLNYFEINARTALEYFGSPLQFTDASTYRESEVLVEYNLKSSTQALHIWDVTDIHQIEDQDFAYNNGQIRFMDKTNQLRHYVAFANNHGENPAFMGKLPNQNLHNHPFAQAFIITHPRFKDQANELAEFHRKEEGYSVQVSFVQDIYNEFSSGHQDLTAIRDYLKYYYDNAATDEQKPKYLLLFGDASYDFKNRLADNTNLVPSYQTRNSVHLANAYVTDDYYGLLDDGEGRFGGEGLDLAIGRFPVVSKEEGRNVVAKIKAYYATKAMRSWRNDLCFIADDEDTNIHINDTEDLATSIEENYGVYNIKKIYFDAYVQEATAGGSRYPDVERRINETVESGVLVMNYMGHGGELGLAHERVVELDDINSWRNIDNMPLMVTATCEFSRYDDPLRVSAGEQIFLNPRGGAIAMLTTTRLVYTNSNKALLDRLFKKNMFERNEDGSYPTLGEVIQKTKNRSGLGAGVLKFALLGDPILTLAYPRQNVVTTHINGQPVEGLTDTVKALSRVEVRGNVTDLEGNVLEDYNGVVYPTVFDKYDTLFTLKNDPDSRVRKFALRKNILYRGKATVENGRFTFSFVVPKDISYKLGYGKISYYTENETIDANGYFSAFLIGGTSDSVVQDDQGPRADLFINDLTFVFGGLTDENPTVIGLISDDNGINTVGTGIGHELTLTLDDGDPIIVNEYYESSLDDYTSGRITYPFKNLAEGRHGVTLKVWDVANNSTEAYTEFVVANSSEMAIKHVLNYPNPFTNSTTFGFQHNKPGEELKVQIEIFDLSGHLIRTLKASSISEGSTFNDITWDGNNASGSKISSGMYVYRLTVESTSGEKVKEVEKLVLLR